MTYYTDPGARYALQLFGGGGVSITKLWSPIAPDIKIADFTAQRTVVPWNVTLTHIKRK